MDYRLFLSQMHGFFAIGGDEDRAKIKPIDRRVGTEAQTRSIESGRMYKWFIAFGLVAITSVRAQDVPWTFQWDGVDCGLIFEASNLTASTKAAIRDDVQRVFTLTRRTNAVFHALAPGNVGFGTYTGWVEHDADISWPKGFKVSSYLTSGTINSFLLDSDCCQKYLQKIALTNQYQTAVCAVSNFISTITTATTNNLSRNAVLELSWSIRANRGATMDDISDPEYRDIFRNWQEFPFHPPVSILDFSSEPAFGQTWLFLALRFKAILEADTIEMPVVYVNGMWRFPTDSD
jgi:hypothetical protein